MNKKIRCLAILFKNKDAIAFFALETLSEEEIKLHKKPLYCLDEEKDA
jgi:hypothetical protein